MSILLEKAENLADAHEEAFADINEVERIRARLAEEPLAQALLDDASHSKALHQCLKDLNVLEAWATL